MTEMWPDNEVSTRNCAHGKVNREEVICSFNGYRWDLDKVLDNDQLLTGCKKCSHRDCEW
jgi:hypothetical protein